MKVLPRFSHLANLSSRSWFDAVLFSTEGVYAAPVCPKWSDQGLSFISVGAGTYGLHLSFSHASCEEAFAPRAPQPRPAERCLLLDSDGHAARLSVPRCGNNRCLIPVDSARWIVDAATQDESAFEIDGVRVRFHEPLRHQSLVGTPQHCKCIFLGDSHTERLFQSLSRTLHRSTHDCTFRFDGDGIYHNLSPDKNLSKFILGKMPNEFVQGHMLSSLAPGSAYDQLQKKENISLWAFQSGHWDLRDVSLETYLEHVAKLFKAFDAFRKRSRARATPVSLLWLGVPAYSFNRNTWGSKELRTNVKLFFADRQVTTLASKYGIRTVPFFSISYPAFHHSCDTHHFYCIRDSTPYLSEIGMAYARLVAADMLETCAGAGGVEAEEKETRADSDWESELSEEAEKEEELLFEYCARWANGKI